MNNLVRIFNDIEDLRFNIKMDIISNKKIDNEIRKIQEHILNLINNDQRPNRVTQ